MAIIEAVHGALVATFKIPSDDKHVRLIAHEPHRFACPPTLTEPELLTLVSIDCFAGRSLQAKRNLYTEIVGRLAGIPNDHVSITLREIETENGGSAEDRPLATSTSASRWTSDILVRIALSGCRTRFSSPGQVSVAWASQRHR